MIKRFLIMNVVCIILLTGCVTSSNKSRGSLNDAMDKSRDDYEEERVVPDEDDYWNKDNEDNSDIYVAATEILDPTDLVLILRVGKSLLSGPYFSSSTGAEILLGGLYTSHTELFLYGGLEILELNKNHSVSESIKEYPFMLTGGVEARYYPIEDLEYFTPYLLGRIGGMILAWEFRNSLNHGDVTTDSLGGFTIDVGIGFDIVHSDSLRLGILCKPQSYLYGIETTEGFTNDYFDVSGLINISAEIGYKF